MTLVCSKGSLQNNNNLRLYYINIPTFNIILKINTDIVIEHNRRIWGTIEFLIIQIKNNIHFTNSSSLMF